ncbi:MAG: EAL domain-containing protein [Spirochaetaceae bacterium]|nr:EAL domain-containing protein [Spirochaetaceae bacterium]
MKNDNRVKKSILVVEDQEASRSQLKALFEDVYDVVEAESGEKALEILERDRYKHTIYLIILDLLMPGMTGFDVLDKIKNDSVYSDIPVIVVTSDSDVESEIEALHRGASDLIIKPYNPKVIFHRVINAIRKIEINEARVENILQKEQTFVTSELSYRANHDLLTGIANKISFCEKTEKMLRENPDKKYVLVRTNIERFKVINDLFGTNVGDIILKDVANTLQILFHEKGTYGRIESDHFAVCFDTSLMVPADICKQIESAIQSHNLNYALQVNIGIYEIDDISVPVDQMCDRANLALQTIKGNYLRQIAYYDATLRNTLLQEQKLVSDMKEALENHEFVIFLQPVYSLYEEKVVSAEALVRWMHPEKGLIAPGGFIPFFEKNGLIARLDFYIWELVCTYQRRRIDSGMAEMPISMNISRMSLYNPRLSDEIIALVEKYNVPPRLIKLEITESAYTDNPSQLLATMANLQSYGFIILMDDFGSGYSSLNMLKDIPVDILKLDMCFLRDFEKSDKSGNILTSVVRMAKWLGIPVVAEGVETQNQLDFLRGIGCDFIQGYYFSRPIPTDEFECLENKTILGHKRVSALFEDTEAFDVLFNGNELTSRLFNSFVGAVGLYDFTEDRLEVLRVNDNYYDMMNYSPQTFHANKMNLFEMVVPEDRPILINACKLAIDGEVPSEIKIRRYLPDGTIIWLSIMVRCLGGSDSHPVICLAMNNITEQKVAEQRMIKQTEKIRRYNRYLHETLDSIPCGIAQYTVDNGYMTIFANKEALRLYGYEAGNSTMNDKTIQQYDFFSLEEREEFIKMLDRIKDTKQPENYTAIIKKTDGTSCPIDGTVSIMKSVSGDMIFQDSFYAVTK